MKKLICFFLFSLSSFGFSFPISRNYAEVLTFLEGVQKLYPENSEFFSLGESDTGIEIMGLKIGNGPINNLLVATHHGNEYGSTEVAKGFALALAEAPIPGQTIYVIPVLNISGYDTRNRYEKAMSGKYLDSNRNYPGPCGTSGPFTLKSTTALARLVKEKNIIASATLHTHFPAVTYPWGVSTKDTSTNHDEIFISLAKAATTFSKYQIGNSTDVVYAADGTFEDYAYWAHGVWSLLYEMGHTHRPTQSAVDLLVSINVPGLIKMYTEAPTERATDFAFTGECNFNVQMRELEL